MDSTGDVGPPSSGEVTGLVIRQTFVPSCGGRQKTFQRIVCMLTHVKTYIPRVYLLCLGHAPKNRTHITV